MRAHVQTRGGSWLEWTGLCEITGKRGLTGSAGPLLNCSEDYITLERDKRLHTRRMGGGHQTRLCPDRAGSNPAEGSADFPQARCHFSLNNSPIAAKFPSITPAFTPPPPSKFPPLSALSDPPPRVPVLLEVSGSALWGGSSQWWEGGEEALWHPASELVFVLRTTKQWKQMLRVCSFRRSQAEKARLTL